MINSVHHIIKSEMSPKVHFFMEKNPKNLERTAPIFQANTHQNMGQSFANFLDEPLIQVFSYKKWTLVINDGES